MKRLILALVLGCVSGLALAQATPTWVPWSYSWVRWDGGAPVGGSNVGPYSGTPVLGDIIYFDGANWVSLAKPADGTYSVKFTTSVPSWIAASGSVPTGTGFYHVTAGAMDAASKKVDVSASPDITGIMGSANGGTGNGFAKLSGPTTSEKTFTLPDASTTIVTGAPTDDNVTVGNGSVWELKALPNCLDSGGNHLNYSTGSNAFSCGTSGYPSPSTTKNIYQEFLGKGSTGTNTPAGVFGLANLSTGTGAGSYDATWGSAMTADHPSMMALTTGTTSTGVANLSTGPAQMTLGGGETIEWMVYVPHKSTGTNTHKITVGACNTASTDCSNGVYFTWDDNTNTHWMIESSAGGSHTGPIASSTVATEAAWHKLTIVVNAGATSVAYYVDGVQLDVSPLATNIPKSSTNIFGLMARIVASAGCATNDLCNLFVDYVNYTKPVTR